MRADGLQLILRDFRMSLNGEHIKDSTGLSVVWAFCTICVEDPLQIMFCMTRFTSS